MYNGLLLVVVVVVDDVWRTVKGESKGVKAMDCLNRMDRERARETRIGFETIMIICLFRAFSFCFCFAVD